MPNAKANALREQIVAAYETGSYTTRELAVRFGVSQTSVCRYVHRKARTGSVRPAREVIPGPTVQIDVELLVRLGREFSMETYDALARRYLAISGKQIDRSSVHRYLKQHGLSKRERRALSQ